MTDSSIDGRSGSALTVDLLFAIAVPLALLAVAYALWAISDRLLVIGPFDRAAFGWIVVLPVSWLAPGIGGLVWSRMPARQRRLAALLLGGVVAVASGLGLATSIDYANCAAVASWTDVLAPSLVIGAVIGIGPALGALAAASVADGLRGVRGAAAAIVTGGLIGFIGLFAAILVFASLFPALSCAAVPS